MNIEQRRAYHRKYYANHRDKVRRKRAEWNEKNPGRYLNTQRNCQLKELYGITLQEYWELVKQQDGKCAICGKIPEPSKRLNLHVDHDHWTNQVRELLCGKCNRQLIPLEDKEWMEKANAYLAKHKR